MKKQTAIISIFILLFFLSGCGIGQETEAVKETIEAIHDPVDRGLCWVAMSVLAHGVLNLFK